MPPRPCPRAVLFDRDATLCIDVPYNGRPDRVVPMPGAREALELLRRAGIPTAVITNQSGIGRGLLDAAQLEAVNARLAELIGPLGPVFFCPHLPSNGCGCRKPRPGLIHAAAAALGVSPSECVVIGDVGSDMAAAEAAGAHGILVPTELTLPEEVAAATWRAPDVLSAVRLVLTAASSPGCEAA